jgi:hypothetical protein
MRISIAWCAAAIGATMLFSVPLIFLLVAHGNHLPFSHETLAFRYFANVRILNGEGGEIYLPQGQLITLLQHLILLMLRAVSGRSFFDLQPMVEWYATATNITTSMLFGAIALAIAFDRRLTWFDRAVIMLTGPFVTLATGRAGFYYTLLPDYYGVDIVITVAAIYLAIALLRDARPFQWRDLIMAGLFWGIAGSNKLTLLGPIGIVVIMAAARAPLTLPMFIFRGAIAGMFAVASFLTIFLLCYLGQPSQALLALQNWFAFFQTVGAENGFWEHNFLTFMPSMHYDLIVGIWLSGTIGLCLAITVRREWFSRIGILWISIVAVALLLVIGLVKRGSGTTLFEMSVIVSGLAAIVFAAMLGSHPRWQFGLPLIATAILLATINFDVRHNWFVVTRSGEIAGRIWQMHDYVEHLGAPGGKTLVFMPDAVSIAWDNSIEDLIALGYTDHNTLGAAIGAHSPFRPLRFVTDASTALPGDVLIRRHDVIQPLIATELPCRAWLLGYYEQLVTTICPIASDMAILR